jgi:2-polyprenyl-6-hydroxyphenyl methylase/3-demethylubiquinone-9 3-methyltransferase
MRSSTATPAPASSSDRPTPHRRSRARLSRNDTRQYDDLVDEWWRPEGAFAALHWLARARGELIPPAAAGDVLVDVGCGGGILAEHAAGYTHIGVDVTLSALHTARDHGVVPVRADAGRMPVADESAAVVVAGEILEHVHDVRGVVADVCRVLRPGGLVVMDTINDTAVARFALVKVAERLPGGPPPDIHDPSLFVSHERLIREFARHGVRLDVTGIRPAVRDYTQFLFDRRHSVRMVPTRSPALVYRGVGTKSAA